MRDFITKNSNSSLKIIHVAVNNIRQEIDFSRIMMADNLRDYLCREISNS